MNEDWIAQCKLCVVFGDSDGFKYARFLYRVDEEVSKADAFKNNCICNKAVPL
jgi:hypothetical protein